MIVAKHLFLTLLAVLTLGCLGLLYVQKESAMLLHVELAFFSFLAVNSSGVISTVTAHSFHFTCCSCVHCSAAFLIDLNRGMPKPEYSGVASLSKPIVKVAFIFSSYC